jgi:hypothetical protein
MAGKGSEKGLKKPFALFFTVLIATLHVKHNGVTPET